MYASKTLCTVLMAVPWLCPSGSMASEAEARSRQTTRTDSGSTTAVTGPEGKTGTVTVTR
nr:hypothetical protein [uncultured Albidiferax sp.]